MKNPMIQKITTLFYNEKISLTSELAKLQHNFTCSEIFLRHRIL